MCRFSQLYFRDSGREVGWTSVCIHEPLVITTFKRKKTQDKIKRNTSKTIFYSMSWITSSVRAHTVNILGFEGHISLSKLLNSAIIVQKQA